MQPASDDATGVGEWLDRRQILKAELMGFADGLRV